jgi:putative Holliday junction resolvase
MARILAIDYGGKRCGIAVTDPLQIIATALTTVDAPKLLEFLKDYCGKEAVEAFVVGKPMRHDGSDSSVETEIAAFVVKLKEHFPQTPVHRVDEMFTSKMAQRSLIDSGVRKKQRRDKRLLDSVAATIILQDYLSSK